MARPHVDLHRGQDQPGHGQGRVALGAHGDELVLGDSVMDMDVGGLLVADRRFPHELLAIGRLVIVAEKDAGLAGQPHQPSDRAEQLARVAAREVGARGAVIGHEHGVADEGGVADQIGHVRRRVARHVQRYHRYAADAEAVAVTEQTVELGAVPGEGGAFVEDLAEHVLDGEDLAADRELAAEPLLKIGGGGEMVGMGVGLEQPFHPETLVRHIGDDRIGAFAGRAPRRLVEIEDAVDDRGRFGDGIGNDVGGGEGRLVEEGLYLRRLDLASKHGPDLLRGSADDAVCFHFRYFHFHVSSRP